MFSAQHRNGEHALPQQISSSNPKLNARLASRTFTAMVTADFDSDGFRDLVSGYATSAGGALLLQRGNSHATAPTTEDMAQIRSGQPVSPFAAQAVAIEVPVRPDLLQAGDLSGFGHNDLIFAAKSGTAAYLLAGDGHGAFAAPQTITLSGAISALAIWRSPAAENLIAAAVCSSTGCGVQLLDHNGAQIAFVPLPKAPSDLQPATLSGANVEDLVALTADGVQVLEGDSLLNGPPQMETISSAGAAAMAFGVFAFDRRGYTQVAVLGADATLHVYARPGVDHTVLSHAEAQAVRMRMAKGLPPSVHAAKASTLGWTEAETVSEVGPGGPAIMLRGRFAGGGYDSLAVMAGGQYVTVDHPLTTQNALRYSTPVVTTDSSSSTVAAAVATRLSADSRSGIVTADSQLHAMYTVPSAYRTMTVNTTTDATANTTSENACINATAGCTLRAAVTVADNDAGSTGNTHVDTINLPAGTYVLSANNGSSQDSIGDKYDYLDIEGSMNLVGAGSALTIINANNNDKAFDMNVDLNATPFDVYFSNLTVENGKDENDPNACGFACDSFGGNMDGDLGGPGQIGFTNVVLANGTDPFGSGGGLFVSNSQESGSSAGLVELDNCTISGNKALNQGGGVFVGNWIPFTFSSDTFTSNTASETVDQTAYNGGDYVGEAPGEGGGLFIVSVDGTGYSNPSPATVTNSTFTSNTAYQDGGGLSVSNGGVTISGSTFTSNTVTGTGTNIGYGGALLLGNLDHAVSVTTSNFTGNSASVNGGAIDVVNGGASGDNVVTVQYSRFHGNTGSGFTGIAAGYQQGGTGYSNTTAIDNWWGCNGPASGTGCDTAGTSNSGSDPITLTPYTKLTIALSTTTPTANASFTATGSLGQNSSSVIYSQANAAAYDGVAASLSITQSGGGTTNSTQTTLNATAAPVTSYAAITTTATATAVGAGTATVTVDGTAVSTVFTVDAADLSVTSTHSGTFKPGDTGDTYSLTVSNVGTASTSGTVSVVDNLPSGFTATAISGTGWTCTLGTRTCTRSDALAASVTYPAITVTFSISSSDAGTYTNSATVSGGNELNTANDTGTDTTYVVAPPQISQVFTPATVAPNTNSTLTVTITNPSGNTVSLTGVGFSETLPTGLVLSNPTGAGTSCPSGTITATAGGTTFSVSGATIGAGGNCTANVNVKAATANSYTSTSGAVTSTNGGTGLTASATLAVTITPTNLVYTAGPPTTITAGGNAGTVTVALEDGSGNVATNNSTAVVTLTVTGPSSYSQTYNATASNGVATFNLSSVPLTVAGTYTYTATASGLTQAQSTETVNPGAAAALQVTGLGPFTAPGTAGTVTVTPVDAYGNLATAYTGTVAVTSSDSSAVISPTSYTFAGAAHNFSVTFNTAGTFTVTATDAGNASVTGSEPGIVVADSVWVLNANTTVVGFSDAGSQITTAGTASGAATALGLAVDNSGNLWGVLNTTSTVEAYTKSGSAITVSGSAAAGVSTPTALAIDGSSRVWVANGNNTVSVLNDDGTAATGVTPAAATAGINTPASISVDSAGSLWIANSGNNTVTEVIGAATPVAAPTVTAVTNATQGAKP